MLAHAALGTRWTAVLFYVAAILSVITRTHGLSISYCSPDNNAGSYAGYYNEFMSNGACQTRCQGSYAFAIIQGYYCWCSNYVPADQESTYNCNQDCPGYPSEWCGSTSAGLYGYYLLSAGVPLGTSGSSNGNTASQTSSASVSTSQTESGPSSSPTTAVRTTSPSSASASASASSFSSPVVTVGSSQSSSVASSITYYSSSAIESTSSAPSSSSSSSSETSSYSPVSTSSSPSSSAASTPSPTTSPTAVYTSVTTVTGEVRTVVVTPSGSADATLGQSATGGGGGSLSTGQVVGIVLGVALGVSGIIGAAILIWFRRRQKRTANAGRPQSSFIPRTGDTSPSNNVPSRQVSQLSSSGLLGSKTPRINTSGLPTGTDPRSADTASSGFDRRSLATDQRLNPYALYIHDESRLSNVSLQDNQDYSRQLRVANPD